MDDCCRTRLYRHERVHQSSGGEIRFQQWRTGILAHEFCCHRLRHNGKSTGRHLCHTALENPPQPQRCRHSSYVLFVLCRHALTAGNGGNLKLHLFDFSSGIFIFHPERTDRALYAGNIGLWFSRCRPIAEPFVQRRTGNRRTGRLGGRSYVRLGVFASARTVVARRAGLAGGVLFFDNRRRHGVGLGYSNRLAQHPSLRPALSFLHRACRYACPTFNDPRL